MKPAIRVENLSKCYRLGQRGGNAYKTLRESLSNTSRKVMDRFRGKHQTSEKSDDFWALKDVSIEVQPGEVVGIIGRNGAGKSTLLKILSRIVEPTSGRTEIQGRMGSLLEVGTGFHPELTGRENIYLNGAILGMKRREIDRRFDEIVAFSEIEQFLDTPVKRYSSGMYVRLAFAVAAHLDPEILIVDEVLAVGDHEFHRKCLGKMSEVTGSRRTVLFVSHNMAAIQSLCRHVAVLDKGRLSYFGPTREGVEIYLRGSDSDQCGVIDLSTHPGRPSGAIPVIRSLRILNSAGKPTSQVQCGESIAFEIDTEWNQPPARVSYWVGVNDAYGRRVFSVGTFLSAHGPVNQSGPRKLVGRIKELPLAPGRYNLDIYSQPIYMGPIDQIEGAGWMDVIPVDFYENGRLPDPNLGTVLVRSQWAVDNK